MPWLRGACRAGAAPRLRLRLLCAAAAAASTAAADALAAAASTAAATLAFRRRTVTSFSSRLLLTSSRRSFTPAAHSSMLGSSHRARSALSPPSATVSAWLHLSITASITFWSAASSCSLSRSPSSSATLTAELARRRE